MFCSTSLGVQRAVSVRCTESCQVAPVRRRCALLLLPCRGVSSVPRAAMSGDDVFQKLNEILEAQKETDDKVGTLQTAVGTLRNDVGTLRNDVGTLRNDVGTLRNDVGTLRNEVKVLHRTSIKIEASQGHIFERQLRSNIASSWGAEFAEARQLRAINDAALMFHVEADTTTDVVAAQYHLMDPMLVHLDSQSIRFMGRLSDLLIGSGLRTAPLLTSANDIDVRELDLLIDEVKDKGLEFKLKMIKRFAESANKGGMLRSCDGPGMMFLMDMARENDGFLNFKTNVDSVRSYNDLAKMFPQSSMQVDCQGTHTFTPGVHASIHMGEVKSGASSGTIVAGTKQLGLACSVMAVIMQRVFDVPSKSIVRTGSIFVPRERQRLQLTEEAREHALFDWKFSLYLREL